jgi:hypothetical protein
MNIETVPFQLGMTLGMGINILDGEPKAPVLQAGEPRTFSGDESDGGLNPADYTWGRSFVVDTAQKYTSMLDVAATVSGSAWTEDGKVNLSSAVSYMRSHRFADSELSFVIARSVMTSYSAPTTEQLKALTLPESVKQLAASDPAAFLDQYGTHVILGFTYGGYFFGSLTIRAGSETDMSRVRGALSVEVNDFELATGKFTTDFASTVKSMNSWYSAEKDYCLMGASQGDAPLDTIDEMQSFLDTKFTAQLDNLGAGTQITALCYAWDELPDVHTIPGYTSGMLTLNIDEAVVDLLREESRGLEYALTTAQDMQATTSCVAAQGAADLQNVYVQIQASKAAIEDLSATQLSALSVDTAQQYLVSTGYLTQLHQIAQGRTSVYAQYYLDGAFSPNTTQDPGECGQWPAQRVFPTSSATPAVITTAQHGDGMIELGYTYVLPPADPSDVDLTVQPPALNDQVTLKAYLAGPKTAPTSGDALAGDTVATWSSAKWTKAPFNSVGVSWGWIS